ncbi:MAG: DUF2336 domain-containing protein [Acetobacteraceae bacterium]
MRVHERLTADPAGPGHVALMAIGTADEAHRVRMAARASTGPEVLTFLARDPSLTVRAAVAMNAAAPIGADQLLTVDHDERVRALLAGKVAALLPGLAEPAQQELREHALATLSALVEDEAERVRVAIAEAVAGMPEAPRALIMKLTEDSSVNVLDPVIRLSPHLTTADLLALLDCPPNPATVEAVARRPNLPEAVSDAVAATADAAAIRLLLANGSAAIRETTLDALIARAAEHEEWHPPLVRRPKLSASAMQALARIVRAELLGVLLRRADFPPPLAAELARRLAEASEPKLPATPSGAASYVAEAEALAAHGALDEKALMDAVRRGNPDLVAARLAVAARVPLEVLERAVALKSAKGLVSLLWKAGFSMRAAGPVQALLTGTPPDAMLSAGPAGSFPLAIGEMRWQVDFLGSHQD